MDSTSNSEIGGHDVFEDAVASVAKLSFVECTNDKGYVPKHKNLDEMRDAT